MHEAFKLESIFSIDKTAHRDEFVSSTSYEDRLLVGSQNGVLYVFKIERDETGYVKIASARSPVRQFARRAIVKLKAFDELGLLVCLCDGVVALHDLNTLVQIAIIEKSKGATDFSAKIARGTEGRIELHICVSVKKRVLLLCVRDRRVIDISPNRELTFPEIIKKIEWVGEKAVVAATKVEYHLFSDIFYSDKTHGLIATSNYTEPFIIPFHYNHQPVFAICQDVNMPLFDLNGNYVRSGRVVVSIKWSEPVIAVEYLDPYLIGLLPKKVEVRSPEPQTNIQNIDIQQKPTSICAPSLERFKGIPSVWHDSVESPACFTTSHTVYYLRSTPIRVQIDHLLTNGDFALANRLGDKLSGEDGRAVRTKIKSDCALAQHAKLEFTKSLELFAECNTDLVSVICLYPGILPDESRSTAAAVDMKATIPQGERHRAYSELADHLVMRRLDVQRNQTDPIVLYTFEGERKQTNKIEALTMIDTATMKCYLEITERLLRDRQMYIELILLYQRFNYHQRALEMLERHAKMADSVLRGHERTVEYLQGLGENDLAVIFHFAEWVVKLHPEDGLKIFTGPGRSISSREGGYLPVESVVNYLGSKNPDLLISYIEFFAINSPETSDSFTEGDGMKQFDLKSLHSRLALLYYERYKRLQTSEEAKASVALNQQQQQQQMSSSLDASIASPGALSLLGGPLPPPGSGTFSPSGSNANQMTSEEAYRKLMNFLATSKYYEPERLMSFFPDNSEPKAMLLGQSGDHKHALSILALSLRKLDEAEQHCDRFYCAYGPSNKVYHIFVSLLLSFRPDGADGKRGSVVSPSDAAFLNDCIERAVSVMSRHASKMDHTEILKLIPSWVPLRKLKGYLLAAVRLSSVRLRQSQLHRALNEAELLMVKHDMVRQHRVHFTVDDESACTTCNMKIGLGTFVRIPNGALAHYLCFKEQGQKQWGLIRN